MRLPGAAASALHAPCPQPLPEAGFHARVQCHVCLSCSRLGTLCQGLLGVLAELPFTSCCPDCLLGRAHPGTNNHASGPVGARRQPRQLLCLNAGCPALQRHPLPLPAGSLAMPLLQSCPNLPSIFNTNIPVLRHVPKAARSAWAQCLARALSNVAVHNSLLAWRELLMLPRLCFALPRVGGGRRREQAAHFTQPVSKRKLWQSQAPRRRAAVDFRACAALVDPRLLGDLSEIVTALQSKHPHAPPAFWARVPTKTHPLMLSKQLAVLFPPASEPTMWARRHCRPTPTRLLPISRISSAFSSLSWPPPDLLGRQDAQPGRGNLWAFG